MAIDFDNSETYDLFMDALDRACQLSTFETRSRVRQMFRDQMKQVAAAEARVAELEAQLWDAVVKNPIPVRQAERGAETWRTRAAQVADERDAALNRVAELEARLAEQEWRPVTEKPQGDDLYVTLVINGYWRNGLFRARSGDEIWDRHVLGWNYTKD